MRSMLARVSRYVVNREPSSEASTGAKKPEDSFRKTRLFISAAKLVCVLVSIYGRAVDAIATRSISGPGG